jgi:cyclophilin family peptidyl-prolyl cis-trans isomerase
MPCTASPFPLHAHHAFHKTQKVSPMADYADPENTLVIETTKGKVVIALRPDLAPNHVAHIKKLAREGQYDGVVFHRVIDGFMAQTGDVKFGNSNLPEFAPGRAGTGGSKYPDIKAEFNSEPHVRGVTSMARSQSLNSANSQFFIVLDEARFLDKQYTAWGKVTSGMDNVDKIKRGEPVKDPDKMISVKVAADVV